MTSTTVPIPRQEAWRPKNVAILTAVFVVAVVVTLSLVIVNVGHGSTHTPAVRSGQSRSVPADCTFRLAAHPC